MAGLELRNGRFNIIVRFGSERFVRSLKTDDEKIALTKKLRVEETLGLIESGRLEVPQNSDFMTFLLSDGKLTSRPCVEKTLRLGELFEEYLTSLPPGNIEESTRKLIGIHRRHLERELGARTPASALSHEEVQNYVNKRAAKKTRRGFLSATTIRKEVATLKSVWNWAVEANRLKVPFPAPKIRYPKLVEPEPFQTWSEIESRIKRGASEALWDSLYLSIEEIEELLSHVKITPSLPCIFPMFSLAAFTGARRSELLRIQVADVDFTARVITIREKKRVRGSVSSRRVPMAAPLEKTLAEWMVKHPGGTHLFAHAGAIAYSRIHGRPGVAAGISIDQAAHYFGQVLSESKWKVIKGWHCLRHSFVSNCASKGVDQRMIDEWVGHTTESMRRRYRHLRPNSQHAAMGTLFAGPAV